MDIYLEDSPSLQILKQPVEKAEAGQSLSIISKIIQSILIKQYNVINKEKNTCLTKYIGLRIYCRTL